MVKQKVSLFYVQPAVSGYMKNEAEHSRMFRISYQDFVCRQSFRGDDALQSLKHQSQNLTALTVLLTAC